MTSDANPLGNTWGDGANPRQIPPQWGTPLTDADYANLELSWITRELADQAMLRRVNAQEGREIVGHKGSRDCAGILFSNYLPGQPRPRSYRIRRDNPEFVAGKDGKPKADRKYVGAPGSGNQLYFPLGVVPEQLQDVALPVVFFEGEKKAIAALRLACHGTEMPRFIPVALPGVWNWLGIVAKANGARGERIDVKGPIPDLSRIEFKDRTAFVLFDSNVNTNPSVGWARKGLARELATRGAEVNFINLPEDCGVNGIDDLLATWGPDRAIELFAKPVHALHREVVLPPQFQSRPLGLVRTHIKGDQLVETQLTNFQAVVKTSIVLDDGVEQKREMEIESELLGRTSRFTVSTLEFADMDWAIAQMGPSAIIFPRQKEFARTAIQSLSLTHEERCIYTHTGWRKVDGNHLYLHGGGAIGATGLVARVQVRLPGSLTRYELRLPSDGASLIHAVQASLRSLKLAPESVSFLLRAATYRSVLGGPDYSMHLVGETGAFKSERAALEQQHFGAGMTRESLPANWSSTANSLETLCFHAKDAVLVIDDYAPAGSSTDIARVHASAARVFRAAGNRAGRQRLNANAVLRDEKPPRGLVLSTAKTFRTVTPFGREW